MITTIIWVIATLVIAAFIGPIIAGLSIFSAAGWSTLVTILFYLIILSIASGIVKLVINKVTN